jgi:hypothetical protein
LNNEMNIFDNKGFKIDELDEEEDEYDDKISEV